MHTLEYDRILATMPKGLEKDVFDLLVQLYKYSSETVTRKELVYNLFGKYVENSKLANCLEDRQIRTAIEHLQRDGYPVISSSGKPGYKLAGNDAEMESYIAELESRRDQLADKIKALRQPRHKLTWTEPMKETQLGLL